MPQTRNTRTITPQQAYENYTWIPFTTTLLGSAATIALLIIAALHFPWIIPNFGWPAFIACVTAGLPGLLLLAALPGLNAPGSFARSDVGGFGVLFGVLGLVALGLMVSVGFTLTATPAALHVATVASSYVLLAVAGGLLSFFAGVLIAERQAEIEVKTAREESEGRPAADNNNDRTPSPSPAPSASLASANRNSPTTSSSTQQLLSQLPPVAAESKTSSTANEEKKPLIATTKRSLGQSDIFSHSIIPESPKSRTTSTAATTNQEQPNAHPAFNHGM